MLFVGNYHSPRALFNNHTNIFEGNEVLLLNPSPIRFETDFLRNMGTLCLKYSLRGTVHLQEFIDLKLSNEEGTVAMIKYNQYFHQRHILIKMTKPLLNILRMADLNQPHIYKLRFMVFMVDDHISMSMPEINDEYYFLPVTELEYYEYEEVPGDDDPP